MTCRHTPGDPNCGAEARALEREYQAREKAARDAMTPDPDKYEVVDAAEAHGHLVMMVQYPNCTACAFEAKKVMVFLNTRLLDAMKWKRIDPHFTDAKRGVHEAPSPAARFPATPKGWKDALSYAAHQAPHVRGKPK